MPITICTFVTVLAVLVGFGFGVRALVLAKSNPEASSLKLIALNLLEPSVTIMILFAVYAMGETWKAGGESIFMIPTLSSIPCTGMLLAPLWTKTTHPIRGTLVT